MAKPSSIIGAGVGRVEGADKVSGQATYGADVHLPGTLWGKILRSPYPHARIKSIDTSKAWKVAGVKAIVTGKDEPEHYQGKSIRDIPVLCWDKVRFVGDKVAAVAAESRDAAEEAVNLIDVEYEQQPAVFDVLDAMKPDAPILHDNAPGYDGAPADIMAAVSSTNSPGARAISKKDFAMPTSFSNIHLECRSIIKVISNRSLFSSRSMTMAR
jgi:CO/xanthine dehydrogenase Mo-binding subunit